MGVYQCCMANLWVSLKIWVLKYSQNFIGFFKKVHPQNLGPKKVTFPSVFQM
jgi:hypothetical protein